jgi:hypothetical protein
MKKNGKIRSNFVKESLLDYNNLANTLKENTESAVRDLLKETVLEQYAKILTEGEDEDDYDVEEVDDTDSVNASEDEGAVENDDAADGMESDDADVDDASADDDADVDTDVDTDADVDAGVEDTGAADGDGEGWSEFDKYKVSDDEYDFSNAEDDEIVKVYKLLKDDDQVVVTKTDDKVNIKDNETGAEYLIDLGGDESSAVEPTDDFNSDETEFEVETDSDDDLENDLENEEDEDMNESRIFEIALNEYNSNVGYTDNYQSKDVMTNPGMSEPGKNVNDWDAGVPKDSKKPWSGKKNDKSENQPFTAEKGKTVEEEEAIEDITEAAIQELKTRQEHTANVGSTSRTDGDNGNRRRKGRSFHTAQNGQETGTGDNPYNNNSAKDVNVNVKVEGVIKKANQIFEENKALKAALNKFKTTLEEAAVTNVNLGNIIKLVMENSTTKDEKKEIIARFGNEARTVDASNTLYESISRELQKKSKMNIDESTEFGVNGNKINETQIYRSNDILNSLDLMHRICK